MGAPAAAPVGCVRATAAPAAAAPRRSRRRPAGAARTARCRCARVTVCVCARASIAGPRTAGATPEALARTLVRDARYGTRRSEGAGGNAEELAAITHAAATITHAAAATITSDGAAAAGSYGCAVGSGGSVGACHARRWRVWRRHL